MSTDECGAYLAHIVSQYESLTDGVFFIQNDNSHKQSITMQQIVDWSNKSGIAPVTYVPLGTKQGAGGNPRGCLKSWQPRLFPAMTSHVDNLSRSGAYRNGLFYASRLVIRQRPFNFWVSLLDMVNTTAMCAPPSCNTFSKQHALKNPHRPTNQKCASAPANCGKACNALEHVWGHMLCEPCNHMPKSKDPRFPFSH